jgi:catechol 2,3-dioxygenase
MMADVFSDTVSDATLSRTLPRGSRLGEVHLAVTDEGRAVEFWTRILGLERLGGSAAADGIRLGSAASGGRTLVALHPGATAAVVPRRTGLYHVALHVPTRKELARVIARLFTVRYPNSPTDHLVSETTYLNDPDGNGIELTLETPDRGEFLPKPIGQMMARTKDGALHSGREAVDLDSLFGELTDSDDLTAPLVSDRVHHVHLHVADIARDGAFYRDLIGFPQQMYLPGFQMIDFSISPDTVVHTLALNSWSGVGAMPAPEGTAGLRRFTIEVPSAAAVADVARRLEAAGWPFERVPGGLRVADPSSNALVVVAPA